MSTNTQQPQSRTLVAYFSATGTTKRVAEAIVNATDATVFEITPKDAYTARDLDWTDRSSRVNTEHDDADGSVALTQVTPDHWDSYDTVYIGYPIWWGDAAWPLETFAKGNDFSGKTVIPFCTSGSSPAGQSGAKLARLAGNRGTWLDAKRFSASTSDAEIAKWVRSVR